MKTRDEILAELRRRVEAERVYGRGWDEFMFAVVDVIICVTAEVLAEAAKNE